MIQEPLLKISQGSTPPVSHIPVSGIPPVCEGQLFPPNLKAQKYLSSLPPSLPVSQHSTNLLNGPILYTILAERHVD